MSIKKSLFVDGSSSDNIIPTPVPNSFLKVDGSGNWIFGSGGGTQNTIDYIVDPDGYFGYSTIQAAVNAAQADGNSISKISQILIWPGDYPENVTVNTNSIIFSAVGGGKDSVLISGAGTNLSLTMTGPGAGFIGLNGIAATVTFATSAPTSYLYIYNSTITLSSSLNFGDLVFGSFTDSNISYSGAGNLLNINPTTSDSNVLIENCNIEKFTTSGYAIVLTNGGGTPTITAQNSRIRGRDNAAILLANNNTDFSSLSYLELIRDGSFGVCIEKTGTGFLRLGQLTYRGGGATSDINVTSPVNGVYWISPYRIKGGTDAVGAGDLILEGGTQTVLPGGDVIIQGGPSALDGGNILLRVGDGTPDGFVKIQNPTGSVDYVEVNPNLAQPFNVKTNAKFDQNVIISGNLIVDGYTTSVDSEIVNIADNHLYLNANYTTPIAQSGGIVVNYLPTVIATTVGASGFTAGVSGASNPTVETVGSGTFSANDLIQISGTNNVSNEGVFEVLSHIGNILTIRGIGLTPQLLGFTQNQFISSVGATGTITKINVSVLSANTSGNWQYGKSNTNSITYQTIGQNELKYTVGNVASGAVYRNIQDAINQAVADGANDSNIAQIIVFPSGPDFGGAYQENLTISGGGIYISGLGMQQISPYLQGDITITNGAFVGLSNLYVEGSITATSNTNTTLEIETCFIAAPSSSNHAISVGSSTGIFVLRLLSSEIVYADGSDPEDGYAIYAQSGNNVNIVSLSSKITATTNSKAKGTAIYNSSGLSIFYTLLDNTIINGKIILNNPTGISYELNNCVIYSENGIGFSDLSSGSIGGKIVNCNFYRLGSTGAVVQNTGSGVMYLVGNSAGGNLTYPQFPAPSATAVYGTNSEKNFDRINFVRSTTSGDPGISTDANTTRAITVKTGDNTSTATGAVRVYTGNNTSTGASGDFSVDTGNTVTGTSGNITLNTGDVSTSGTSGSIDINVGDAVNSTAGTINLNSGDVVSGTGLGGDIRLNAGYGNNNTSGQIVLQGAQPSGTNGSGSLIRLSTGAGLGTGTGGNVIIETPTHSFGSGGTGAISISTGSTNVSSTGSTGTLSLSTGSIGVTTSSTAGNITITAGSSSSTNAASTGGSIDITSGNATAGNAGRLRLWAGDSSSTGLPGEVNIKAGGRTAGTGPGNSVFIVGGNSRSATGGGVLINTGVVTGGVAQGGPFTVTTGNGSGAAPGGNVNFVLGSGGSSPAFSIAHSNLASLESLRITDTTASTRADGYLLAWDNVNTRNYYRDPSTLITPIPSWASVLAVGNTSGAADAIMSNGTNLRFAGNSNIIRNSDNDFSISYSTSASAAGGGITILGQNNGGVFTGGGVTIRSGGTSGGSSGPVYIETKGNLGGSSGAIKIQTSSSGGTLESVGSSSGNIDIITGPAGSGNTGSISIATSNGSGGSVGSITLSTGNGGAGSGGTLNILSGSGGSAGGPINITSGNGGSGAAGSINISGGTSSSANSGSINITAGDNSSTFSGGSIVIFAGSNTNSGTNSGANISMNPGTTTGGGSLDIFAGNAGGVGDTGGSLTLRAGNSNSGIAGDIVITNSGGTSVTTGQINISTGSGNIASGSISLSVGSSSAGTAGNISITSGGTDTGTAGTLSISAGSATGNGFGGPLIMGAGSSDTGIPGFLSISAGGAVTSGNGGNATIAAGGTAGGTGGTLTLNAGTSTGGNGGDVAINSGGGNGGTGSITLTTPGSNSPTGSITLVTGNTTGAPPGSIALTTGNGSTGSGANVIVTLGTSTTSNKFEVIHSGASPSTSLLLRKETATSRADGYVLSWNASGYNTYVNPSSFYVPNDTQLLGTATTTDATNTFINSFTVPTNTVIQYEARVVAKDTSSSNAASGWRISGVFGNNAGTVTQQGITTLITEEKSNALFAVDFSISGTAVRVQVNGVLTATVSWKVFSSIVSV